MVGINDVVLFSFAFVVVFVILMRKHFIALFRKWWLVYQEQKKYDELYARLDRNKAGKFNQKEYLKSLEAQKKSQMKKNRDAAAEKKSVKGK